jgi:hypothetical protein
MIDSSATRADPFDGLEWRHVLAMLTVLRECEYTKTEHIGRRYAQYASNFQKTLAFMVCLRAVFEKDGHVRPSDRLRVHDANDASLWLVDRLFATRNRYRTQIFRYLRRFQIIDGEPLYRPSSPSRHQQSHLRNCLMEMGIVCHDRDRDCYHIAPQHLDLYIVAQDSVSKRTPVTVAAAQHSRETLGTAAEEAVVLYERRRVGSRFAELVQHVALLNTAAGYDVRSVTVSSGGISTPRYIEVKAVSSASFQFYWTRNEVATAKHLAQWYYLYLLPVEAGRRFSMDHLEVIRDPHAAVLQASENWVIEPDVLRCCRRHERGHWPVVSADGP